MTREADRTPHGIRCGPGPGAAGSLVGIRHAGPGDYIFVRQISDEHGMDRPKRDLRDCVVAESDGRIVGFGTTRKSGRGHTRIEIVVERGKEYLSDLIARQLAGRLP